MNHTYVRGDTKAAIPYNTSGQNAAGTHENQQCMAIKEAHMYMMFGYRGSTHVHVRTFASSSNPAT